MGVVLPFQFLPEPPDGYGDDEERVHDFSTDSPRALAIPELILAMARTIAGYESLREEIEYAAMLDEVHGSDDASVACAYGYLFSISSSPRITTERAIAAADFLRQSPRTMH
jgi:hypothetical protein